MNKAIKILEVLQRNGYEAVYAGGCVRDMLLGLDPHDIDIATSALPEEVEKLFERTIPVGKQFGVIIVIIDNEEFEVASFRTDSVISDGRRPDSVYFCSMEEDAKRRDLTINAMFFDPISNIDYDFVGGKKDLKDGVIRFVGDPEERIEEDKLRILRAVRFASKFNFHFERKTLDSIMDNSHRVMGNVSAERIKSEMEKMLLNDVPSEAMNLLFQTGILGYIFPDLFALTSCLQSKKWHSEGSVWKHTMLVLDATRKKTDDLITLWGALFHDIGKPETVKVNESGNISNHGHEGIGVQLFEDIAKKFKFSTNERKLVSALISDHMKPYIAKDMKISTIKKLRASDHFDRLLVLSESDCEGSIPVDRTLEDKKKDGVEFLKNMASELGPDLPKPLLTGRDLIDLGLKPGIRFRTILSDAMERQLNDKITNREEALEYASRCI